MRGAGVFGRVARCIAAGGLALAAAGCVTQDWVTNTIRDMNKPLEADVAELKQSSNIEKTRVYQLTERMGAVESRAGQLAAQGGETRGVADSAARTATEAKDHSATVDRRLTSALANRMKREQVHEAVLTFKTGKADLSPAAQADLGDVAKMLAENTNYTCDIVGNTDKVGAADYNVDLSYYRHAAVRRFLAQQGVDLHRIHFIGLGKEQASGTDRAGMARDRNVIVRVFRPVE